MTNFTDIFNTSFFIILAIILLVVALLVLYYESKMRDQNHKIASMLSLVSTLAEDMNVMKMGLNTLIVSGGTQYKHADSENLGITKNNIHNSTEENLALIEVSDDETNEETDDESDNEGDNESDNESSEIDENVYDKSNLDSHVDSSNVESDIESDLESDIESDLESDIESDIESDNIELLNENKHITLNNTFEPHNNLLSDDKKNIKVLTVNLLNDKNNDNFGQNDESSFDLNLEENEYLENFELTDEIDIPEIRGEYTEQLLSLQYDLDTKEDNNTINENNVSLVEVKKDENDLKMTKSITINLSDDTHNTKDETIDYKKLQLPKLRTIVVEKGLVSNTDASKLKKNEILKLLGAE